jgi:hypothetical protein
MPGLAREGKTLWLDAAVGDQRDTGQQAARNRLEGWKRFPMAGMLTTLGKTTVDGSPRTYTLEMTGGISDPSGPRLSWPLTPVKRFVAAAR